MKRITVFWLLAIAFLLVFSTESYAYIDPGAGSNYLQNLLAGLFALLAGLKKLFSRTPSSKNSGNHEE